jgi:hypothetical protein
MWRIIVIFVLTIGFKQAAGQPPTVDPSLPQAQKLPPFLQATSPLTPGDPASSKTDNPVREFESLQEALGQPPSSKKVNPVRRFESLKIFAAKPLAEDKVSDALEKLKISRHNAVIAEISFVRSWLQNSSDPNQGWYQLTNTIDRYYETATALAKSGQEQRNILENCVEYFSWFEEVAQNSDWHPPVVHDTRYRKLGYQILLLNMGGEITSNLKVSSVSPQSIHNQQLLNLRSLDQYFKVNDRPIELRKPSPPRPSDVPYGPHFANSSDRSFSNICVNAKARDIIIAGKGIYPVGSIVINVVSNTSDTR